MDWLDLLAVQGTLKSLLQHHSPKASVLRCFWWRPTNCLTVPSTFPHYESVRPAFNRGERPLFLRLLCTYREPHVLKPNCMQEGLGRQRPHVWFSWNGPWSPLHPVQGWWGRSRGLTLEEHSPLGELCCARTFAWFLLVLETLGLLTAFMKPLSALAGWNGFSSSSCVSGSHKAWMQSASRAQGTQHQRGPSWFSPPLLPSYSPRTS